GVLQHDIAEIHATRGEYEQALALEREALAVLRRAGPDGQPDIVAVLGGLGRAELERGDAAAALPPLRAALATIGRADADPELDAEIRFTLARALVRLGREPTLARRFAGDARRTFVKLGARGAPQLAKLDTWWRASGFAGGNPGD
ncbi:MAG TPA: tetratricopeptide repeat protein, partial [Nannocystaceae bacterium]|nr:tetratricopeptide repeat protein [Nannocystaceae bacterium]